VVSVLTPAEILIAARRLAGARPHLAAVAGIVHPEDLWQLCRDELRVDVRIDGWDIRGRWFGAVVGATPRTGELPRGETIPWRVIAAQIAPCGRAHSVTSVVNHVLLSSVALVQGGTADQRRTGRTSVLDHDYAIFRGYAGTAGIITVAFLSSWTVSHLARGRWWCLPGTHKAP
jgi:hypothetical protein